MDRRIVLYPQGYLGDLKDAAHCASLTQACGGDPGQVFDVKKGSLTETVRLAASIVALARARQAPIVVLIETNPIRLFSMIRSKFQHHAAIFETAVWAVYWCPSSHRTFPSDAASAGKFEGDLSTGAFWFPSEGEPFLVLSPDTEPSDALHMRAEDCVRASSSSGARRIEGQRSILGVRLGWSATLRK
jgi:hypothetical protein